VEFKDQVYISNYCEINPNSIFNWNSNFWFPFARNLLLLAIRCNKELASQISSNFKVPRISSEFLLKFEPSKLLWILVQNPVWTWGNLYKESCSLYQILSNHILFQIFGDGEDPVGSRKVWRKLKLVWTRLNFCSVQTEFRIAPPVTVLPGPASQCPAATLPRSPLSLPHLTADTGPPTHPTPLVSHIALRRPRPAALPCSATTTSPTPDGWGLLPATFHCLMLPTDAPGPLSLSHFPPSTRHRP
jgi:hypothetical protein